ncbi:MAG: HAD hydrolase-like protein [Polyangiaceae bacterium]
MIRPRLIIFDLDGTLIDSRGDIAAACNYALEKSGRPPLTTEKISTMVGDGARALIARAFDLPGESPDIENALPHFHAYYTQNPADFSTYLPGAISTLSALRERGLQLALATNKPRATTLAVMAAMDMSKYFSAVTAGGDGPLKPAPDPLLRIFGELSVAPRDAWMIGDGTQDIGAARAVGCTAIAVGGGFVPRARLEAAKPDAWIDSLEELLSLY